MEKKNQYSNKIKIKYYSQYSKTRYEISSWFQISPLLINAILQFSS